MTDPEEAIRHCYSTWGQSYYEDYYTNKAHYPPVHQDIIRKELQRSGSKNLLDAGCGPASILRDLTELEMDLFGFDLTSEMVQECKKVMSKLGYDPDQFWEGSVTQYEDFCGPTSAPAEFDASICIGVLPHIPPDQDDRVFSNLRKSVKKGGLVMIEARNELFSLFTLNRYSFDFFRDRLCEGEIPEHLQDELKKSFKMDLPKVRKGKKDEPGYDEVLSRTHNPFEVKMKFEQAGFKNVQTLFYHFHGLPPMFEKEVPKEFEKLSLAMEKNPKDWRGHFMASAFLITGTAT
jgi:SAM-dependent methyltransferase